MDSALTKMIAAAAADARSLLGQLGPLVWALHEQHGCVLGRASQIALDPCGNVHTNSCVDPTGLIRARATCDIGAVIAGIDPSRRADVLSSAGLRDVINRSIVVYAVAVLERFLDHAGKQLWSELGGTERKCSECRRTLGWPPSFGGMVDCLKSVDVDLHGVEHYPSAALLSLYRHKIVHEDARVDDKLPRQVADIESQSGRKLRFSLSVDQSSVVWVQCGGTKVCCAWTCKSISLAIDEVVLPLLSHAQAFVAEAAEKLREAAGNCPRRRTT